MIRVKVSIRILIGGILNSCRVLIIVRVLLELV